MKMTRVTVGVTSSPFLATQVLWQLAQDYQDQYPQAAGIIMQNVYPSKTHSPGVTRPSLSAGCPLHP